MPPPKDHNRYLAAIAGYIRGKQIAVYLRGRDKPITELTVCGVYPNLLLCRANSSTHLVNPENILFIRFAPDSEPGRDVNHSLHSAVSQKGGQPISGQRETPGGPRGNHERA